MSQLNSVAIEKGLRFLREIERLKDTLRSGVTAGGRSESTAEHTWRLAMMVVAFSDQLPREVDQLKLLKICLIHDLGETYAGDVPAIFQRDDDGRKDIERADMERLCALLDDPAGSEIIALWHEYEAGTTLEARYAKGFDKIETILQHTQGDNPADFDYAFNETYGRASTDKEELIKAIREPVDRATRRRASGLKGWSDET